ncbi:MAG: PAS domain-containing protein [archaeon]
MTEEKELNQKIDCFRLLGDLNRILFKTNLKGNITYINKTIKETYGLNQNKIIGRNFKELIEDENKLKFDKIFKELLKKKKTQAKFEYSLKISQGKERIIYWHAWPLKEENKITGIYGIGRDVTEYREAGKKINELNEKLKAVFDSIQEGMIILNNKREIIFANQTLLKQSKYTEKDIIGKKYDLFVPKKYMNSLLSRFKKNLEGKPNPPKIIEYQGKKNLVPVIITSSPIIVNKKVTGVVVSLNDVTEKRKLEAELKESNHKISKLNQELKKALKEKTSKLDYTIKRLEQNFIIQLGKSIQQIKKHLIKMKRNPENVSNIKRVLEINYKLKGACNQLNLLEAKRIQKELDKITTTTTEMNSLLYLLSENKVSLTKENAQFLNQLTKNLRQSYLNLKKG